MTLGRENKEPSRERHSSTETELRTEIIRMERITKRFPGVLANNNIEFEVRAREIHALLGENGAGKTTLMNILYGLLQPDEGEMYVYGQKVSLRSPKDAINLGIGMVHQHFTLIPPLSVAENIVLGLKSPKEPFLDLRQAQRRIENISEKYGLKVDPKAKIHQLSVGEQQRVEIIKSLYRGAKILILDEPTSVLTPPEIRKVFVTLRRIALEGNAVIFITHKLKEALAISDRMTVLKQGKVVGKVKTSDTNEKDLVRMLIGREVSFGVPQLARQQMPTKGNFILEVKDLCEKEALRGITFSVREGEILGIAGVAGNGQRELAEVVTGIRKVTKGKVFIRGKDMTNRSPYEFIRQGVSYIPEDRIEGLILDFSVAENTVLKTYSQSPFCRGGFLRQEKIPKYSKRLVSEYDVKISSIHAPARQLSGGNMQRLILARELSRNPRVLVAHQPTRGLDIIATQYVHLKLLELRNNGGAILLISEDLDEVISLSDRVAVIYEGQIVGVTPIEKTTIEEIGLMMTGTKTLSS